MNAGDLAEITKRQQEVEDGARRGLWPMATLVLTGDIACLLHEVAILSADLLYVKSERDRLSGFKEGVIQNLAYRREERV